MIADRSASSSGAVNAEAGWNEVESVILRRRSVRLYKKEQVPEELVKRILEAGRFAPSAGNSQPWKFVVVRDQQIIDGLTEEIIRICKLFKSLIEYRIGGFKIFKKALAKLFTKFMPNDLHPVPFSAIPLIADRKLSLYHGAPTAILIFKDVRGVSKPDLDCGIAGQNMVLAAHSLGLGTCWVSFTKLAFEKTGKWKKFFGIGYPYKFVTSIAVGYPVGSPDGFVHRDTHKVDWYEDGSQKTLY